MMHDTTPFYPPAIELFRSRTRRALVRHAIENTKSDTWSSKSDLATAIDTSRESVRKQFSSRGGMFTLVEMGIYDVSNPDADMPRYRVADSAVIDELRAYEDAGGYPLDELFEYSATQDMVLFFLEGADPETSYSQNAIHKEADVHYTSVQNHIDTLVDAEIVEPVEGTRATEYRYADSRTTRFILALNGLLVDHIETTE